MPTYTRTGEGSVSVRRSTDNQLVEISPQESIQTYQILGSGWEKTSDEPYYPLGHIKDTLVLDGASPGSVEDLSSFRFLQITTDGDDIVVTANSAANPFGYPLQANIPFFIENKDGVIDVLHFTGTGSVVVVGLDR